MTIRDWPIHLFPLQDGAQFPFIWLANLNPRPVVPLLISSNRNGPDRGLAFRPGARLKFGRWRKVYALEILVPWIVAFLEGRRVWWLAGSVPVSFKPRPLFCQKWCRDWQRQGLALQRAKPRLFDARRAIGFNAEWASTVLANQFNHAAVLP